MIRARLQKTFETKAGNKAVKKAAPEGILRKQVMRRTIAKLHGVLKRKPSEKSFAEAWAEHKREERELEDRGHGRDRS